MPYIISGTATANQSIVFDQLVVTTDGAFTETTTIQTNVQTSSTHLVTNATVETKGFFTLNGTAVS